MPIHPLFSRPIAKILSCYHRVRPYLRICGSSLVSRNTYKCLINAKHKILRKEKFLIMAKLPMSYYTELSGAVETL